jgi:hypothetical protein
MCVNNFAEVLEEKLMGLKDGLSEDEFQKLIETLSHRKEKNQGIISDRKNHEGFSLLL